MLSGKVLLGAETCPRQVRLQASCSCWRGGPWQGCAASTDAVRLQAAESKAREQQLRQRIAELLQQLGQTRSKAGAAEAVWKAEVKAARDSEDVTAARCIQLEQRAAEARRPAAADGVQPAQAQQQLDSGQPWEAVSRATVFIRQLDEYTRLGDCAPPLLKQRGRELLFPDTAPDGLGSDRLLTLVELRRGLILAALKKGSSSAVRLSNVSWQACPKSSCAGAGQLWACCRPACRRRWWQLHAPWRQHGGSSSSRTHQLSQQTPGR